MILFQVAKSAGRRLFCGQRVPFGDGPGCEFMKKRSGPVSRVLSSAIISLGCRLPGLSSSLPEGLTDRTDPWRGEPRLPSAWPCSGWGLPCQSSHLDLRCALTAPFHPYLCPADRTIGGVFSVALSLASRPVGVTDHPCPVEPGLSSTTSPSESCRDRPGPLPGVIIRLTTGRCKVTQRPERPKLSERTVGQAVPERSLGWSADVPDSMMGSGRVCDFLCTSGLFYGLV